MGLCFSCSFILNAKGNHRMQGHLYKAERDQSTINIHTYIIHPQAAA